MCFPFSSPYTLTFLLQTGGQDDLVTVLSPWEQRIVARCQGHSSFVSSVAFDPVRIDNRTYRFGSVGEDNRLIFVSRFFSSFQPIKRINICLW